MKKALLALLCAMMLLSAAPVFAAETKQYLTTDFAFYPANQKGYEEEGWVGPSGDTVSADDMKAKHSGIVDEGRDIGSGGVEARTTYTYEMKIPMMTGSGPLMSGNNLTARFKGELTPVSIAPVLEATLTPIAFFNVYAGSYFGTGWTLMGLNGLALNTPDDPYKSESGLVYKFYTGVTFQFDLAAVMPGDWNHVLIMYSPKVEYAAFTGAGDDDPWQYQVDAGENFNGSKWYQTFFLGYQMPAVPVVDTAGVLVETNQRLTKKDESTMDHGGWGSDFMEVGISPLVNLKFNDNHSLAVLFNFANARDYTDDTVGNEHFYNRKVDKDSDTYWYFKRLAFSYTYTF